MWVDSSILIFLRIFLIAGWIAGDYKPWQLCLCSSDSKVASLREGYELRVIYVLIFGRRNSLMKREKKYLQYVANTTNAKQIDNC